ADDVGPELRACNVPVLPALRHAEVRQNHLRVLLQGQLYGIAQGQLERSSVLTESAPGQRQYDRNPQRHGKGSCTSIAKEIQLSIWYYVDYRSGEGSGCPNVVSA